MNKVYKGIILGIIMLTPIITFSAPDNRPSGTMPDIDPSVVLKPERVANLLGCSVTGSAKEDPNNKTYGYRHYVGTVTVKSGLPMQGVNLSFFGPEYSCECTNCPKPSSHAGGISPEGEFKVGESRTFNLDCPSWRQELSGPIGKARVEYFVQSKPNAGYFAWKDCSGNFMFTK